MLDAGGEDRQAGDTVREHGVDSVGPSRLRHRGRANRVLELSSAGPRVYGGNYDEYVASTGREAPGMRVQ